MPESDVEVARKAVTEAITNWRNAPDKEKGPKAAIVMSHVGAVGNVRLVDFTDKETSAQIRTDYASTL